MEGTRPARPAIAPVPSTVQGKSTLGKLLFAFNASVAAFSIVCYLVGYIYLAITHVNLSENRFTIHGLKYFPYFFSLWGSAVQSIYFYAIFGIDIIEIYSRNSTRLYKIRNNLKSFTSYLFFTAVFPMSVTICTLFWAFYFFDRELIYPRVLDEIYPTWVNHTMHSIPVLLVFICVLIESEPPMKHTLPGMIGILTFYAACTIYVRQRDNKWIYIALHEFKYDRVIQLFSVGVTGCIFTTMLGHTISRAVQSTRAKLGK